jgi:hypothetical protein
MVGALKNGTPWLSPLALHRRVLALVIARSLVTLITNSMPAATNRLNPFSVRLTAPGVSARSTTHTRAPASPAAATASEKICRKSRAYVAHRADAVAYSG